MSRQGIFNECAMALFLPDVPTPRCCEEPDALAVFDHRRWRRQGGGSMKYPQFRGMAGARTGLRALRRKFTTSARWRYFCKSCRQTALVQKGLRHTFSITRAKGGQGGAQ